MSHPSRYGQGLEPNPANHVPLSPVTFLSRAAAVYPDRVAVVHGDGVRTSYAEMYQRCRRLAGALAGRGIGPGDTVSVLAPNVPALLEAHYAVPMLGAVLNTINIRLDSATVAYILDHGEASVLIADTEFAATAKAALDQSGRDPLVVDYTDPEGPSADVSGVETIGTLDYEALLAEGDPEFAWEPPADEWWPICLNYTSGTTGQPKGVVYHHRGAYLNALGNLITLGLDGHSRYLWTLPMFHCNGWSHTWAVTAATATHVCLRRVDPAAIFPMIRDHRVTHLSGAPIVLNMLAHAPDEVKIAFDWPVRIATGGASPPSSVIERMEELGFEVQHLYGLTETFGPSMVCAWQDEWSELPLEQRAARCGRQGVSLITMAETRVIDQVSGDPVPADGETIGEIVHRGNTVMRGYLKNPEATAAAFADGWYHTGDLAVLHPDGYVEIKDRSKDIINSGGEKISSVELEEVLYRHPKILESAVVARPDETWGESPCAFVTLEEGAEADAEEIIEYCRQHLARFKVPRRIVFCELPKTATGKIQKYVLREQAKEI